MTGISSYNSQLTPAYLLHTEKGGKPVLLFVFNMVFPTSLFLHLTYLLAATFASASSTFAIFAGARGLWAGGPPVLAAALVPRLHKQLMALY